jgi:hypothetical protein
MLPVIQVEHRGAMFDCYLLPPSDIPDELVHVVASYTPTRSELRTSIKISEHTFFALDQRVPVQFRPYWVRHEIIALIDLGCWTAGYRTMAAEAELDLVRADPAMGPDVLKEYLRLRSELFAALAAFASGNKDAFTTRDADEYRQAHRIFHAALRE